MVGRCRRMEGNTEMVLLVCVSTTGQEENSRRAEAPPKIEGAIGLHTSAI